MPETEDILKAIDEAIVENKKIMGEILEILDQILSVLENIERNTRK
jgi:hypothetical protein